jgi:hypothetical protein
LRRNRSCTGRFGDWREQRERAQSQQRSDADVQPNAKNGQEVVFGEFSAGGGPFYLTSFQTPPGMTLPEGLMTVVNKEKGSALEIDA